MGRISTLVLIGVGVFFLALAPLVKFWAADKLIAAPADQFGISYLEAKQAQYFSAQDLKVLTADLDIIVTTKGDVKAAGGDRVVWDESSVVNDATNARKGISISARRSAFDKYSGVGVNCCNVNADQVPVKLEGQIYKFPFDVQKKTYKVFNSTALAAFDATYVREEKVNGLNAYVFEQVAPPTKTDTLTIPASVLNIVGVAGDVQVDRWYDGKTTFWIEPATGGPIKQEQQRHEVLKTQDGVERAAAFVATASMTDQTVGDLVKNTQANLSLMNMLRTIIPLALLVIGLIVIALAVLRGRKVGTVRPTRPASPVAV